MSLPLLIILVPIVFAFMGFALDLGRLYLVRGELNQAANSAAIAAAQQLIGTDASLGNATTSADQVLAANTYNFGSIQIGASSGNLTSTINAPAYYAAVADAAQGSSTQADGATARHVTISLTADAPLLFWSLLPGGESRKTPIAAQAVAGVSAPLCSVCGVEPFAVQARDPSDTVNFGFGDPLGGQVFTFAYSCTGNPAPGPLAGTGIVVPYLILNRYDASNATADETQQLFRSGAAGVPASTGVNPTGSSVPLGCFAINDSVEVVWASAAPAACATRAVQSSVAAALCGMYSRFDTATQPNACVTSVTDFANLSASFAPDTDTTSGLADLYANYSGTGKRVITVAIVDTLAGNTLQTMTILGFRQFLVEPNSDGSFPDPGDLNGRFPVQYIGSPMPVKQGYVDDRFALACPAGQVGSGPGKVVLHQ
jgi:Flp pilus assembly protein TadG